METVTARSRLAEIRRLTDEMDSLDHPTQGHYNVLGMLVNDATLAADAPALQAAQDGLQWLCRRYPDTEGDRIDGSEHRGRLLGLIDVTHWALRRLPTNLQLSLSPDSHATRFLMAVARRPGLSNRDLAAELHVDDTEISRIGRRLMAAGVVWRRKEWRTNLWDVTPRGRQYLDASKLLRPPKTPRTEPPVASATVINLRFALGITINPERLVGVMTDRDLKIVASRERRLARPLSGPEARAELADFVRELVRSTPEIEEAIGEVGLGVAIGGHVSADGTVVSAPNHTQADWTDAGLGHHLAGDTSLPTVIENDANALAEYEHAFGAHRDLGCTATVLLDEGIGCGIVVDNHLVRGFAGSAGEIGHITVRPGGGGECHCGRRDCLETVAGANRISDGISDPGAKDLVTASVLAEEGNAGAIEGFVRAGGALGQGLLALLNLVNPQQIVIYGPAELVDEKRFASARRFLTAVREASTEHAFSDAGSRCTLVPKVSSDELGARAAAAIALLRLGQDER